MVSQTGLHVDQKLSRTVSEYCSNTYAEKFHEIMVSSERYVCDMKAMHAAQFFGLWQLTRD